MSMTGAIVNALAIVAGGAVGLLFQRGIPERVSKTVMIGLGLCVLYIGISGAFACQSILIVIVAMTLGAAAGALLNIDGAIHCLGTWVEAHVHRHEGGPSLAEGFVTASLLCCVGAMAVNGSLDAGIRGDNSILLTKSMIDLVFCAMLATTLGAGVMLAGAAVFVVEGALTLLAGAILTETIFSWPGLGRWLIDALQRRDYPVVQGGVLLVATMIILVNLLVDLLYGVVNPRIRHKK